MAQTIFVYTRDQDGLPIFFRAPNTAHFVRGPIKDNSTRPVYFTGGPAARPSYTMLPFATSGAGDKPQEFFTLGLPRPDMSATPVDSSEFSASVLSVDPALYKQVSKQTYSASAGSTYDWPIGALTPNGIDDVLVYLNCGIKHTIAEQFDDDDTMTLTISLIVGSDVIDSVTIDTANQAFDSSNSRWMVYAGVLRAPASAGTKNYSIRFESSGTGFTMADVTRQIYMLDLGAFHENTTINVDGDFRFLSAGDSVEIEGVGASFTSQSTELSQPDGNIFNASAQLNQFNAAYVDGSTGRVEEQSVQSINGSKEVVRATSSTIVVRGAWPWNLTGAGGSVSFEGLENVGDDSAVQSVGYVVTFLTTVGAQVQEGPPSAMSSLLATRPGMPVTLSGLPTGTSEEGDFRFSGKRLYRANVTTDEVGILQFVAELPIEQTEYVDTVRSVDLGEELQTEDWIMPPSDMHSLVACHNGMLAGISGNQVCVSVPYQPHAFPVRSRFNIGDEPVALVAVGETIIVLTKGRPSVVFGIEPGSMRVAQAESAYPCLSADGAVGIGDAAVYPSTVGLVAMPARGSPVVITEQVMEKEEWAAYYPETIIATEHYGKYLAFYDDGTPKSFLLDPKSRIASLVDLDISGVACCTDELNGQAIFVTPEQITKRFDPVSGDHMEFVWRSKSFATQRPWCPSYGRVVAELYPVTFRLYANKPQPGPEGAGSTTEADMQLIIEKTVTSSRPFTLPGNYRANAFQIELTNVVDA